MRQKLALTISLFLTLLATPAFSPLLAQDAPSVPLGDQLKAQYTLVKLGTDSNGLAVLQPGTVLVIQQGGILGVPPTSSATLLSKYENGVLHSPNSFLQKMAQNSRFLTKGEKVYPRKIEVDVNKDKISFFIIECDSCNGVQQPSFYKSDVVFEFPKGTLKTTSVPRIEDTIAQVFAFDQGSDSGQANQGGQDQGNGNQGAQQAQGNDQQSQQQAGPPPTIQLGESIDQVQAALGQPDKIVNLGAKQIYIYKDLKITFMNGKVSDVQ